MLKNKFNPNITTTGLLILLFIGIISLVLIKNPQLVELIELYSVKTQFYNYNLTKQIDTSFEFSPFIAHAGGEINNLTYTNSLEAIQSSYQKGFRLIEVDLFLTADNKIILTHDKEKPITGLTKLTFKDLANLIIAYDDLYIVTDQKNYSYQILSLIASNYPEIKNKIIPQIYYFQEYYPVLKLGYNKIILSNCKAGYSEKTLNNFIKNHPVNIVTIPYEQALTSQILVKNNTLTVYSYPINDLEIKNQLTAWGVDGIYTSYLMPN